MGARPAVALRPSPLIGLAAVELRDRLAGGALRCTDLAEALLAHIAATEPETGAWAWHDPEHVRAQARALDAYRGTGRPLGALHGVPVGLTDIIDTAGIPTENGTVLDAGRKPATDAFVVARLKAAGALVMGKTVSTPLASMAPADTRNPAAPGRTPGGSSAGSAAAVAAGHVPLAIGTQTAGSVIRPAAYCGTVGFKPSFGAIPRSGILAQSPTLDTVGVFARSVSDAALLAEALYGHDSLDRATAPAPHPQLLATATTSPPVTPVLALVRPPGWDAAAPEMREGIEELAASLGEQCFEAPLPNAFDEAAAVRERINFAEMAKCYHAYERRGRDTLPTPLRAALDAGKAIPARDYIAALDWSDVLYAGLGAIFTHADAVLAPAAPGPAPEGYVSTGDPIFNGLWTMLGVPAVTLPLLEADSAPMGVQLIGARGDDARLLRTARWLMDRVLGTPEGGTA
jgi:Asp-tRNA(Asn)/Glu-tRNA(Gln) amidotransferase A subunit family amidase